MTSETFHIESLLSARQLIHAKLFQDKIYFISNLSGSYSLYQMSKSISIPIPLLPEGTALQNPHLMNGPNYFIFPKLNKILVMIDDNGNELYQPCFIPLNGGIPELAFGARFQGMQVNLGYLDHEKSIVYFHIDDRKTPGMELFKYDFSTKSEQSFGKSPFGVYFTGVNASHTKLVHAEGYAQADIVLFLNENNQNKTLLGIPLSERKSDTKIKLNDPGNTTFVENDTAVVFKSILRTDKGSFYWMSLNNPQKPLELEVKGLKLPDSEIEVFDNITKNQFYVKYNVDGTTHIYLLDYIAGNNRYLNVTHHLIGKKGTPISNGVVLSFDFDHEKAEKGIAVTEFVVSFTKATSPSQLYLIELKGKDIEYSKLSNETVLGIDVMYLSEGEDASYNSFDGLRISARIYRPSVHLKYPNPRPLVYYVHGGPQGQERPDFTWFSMPLIQFLTLNGFIVFVPNVRGSTGYGIDYSKKVERDWGGNDIKDHLEALKFLEKDKTIDSTKRGVTGRSYGGYMTLSLVSRYPDLWKAGIDMFGPSDLIGFFNRLPPSWQAIFEVILGHPEKDKAFLIERSPKTYFDNISAPLLVIQGANDPRVTLTESKEIVEYLKGKEKDVDILVFDDEGHDVIKFKNKVKCYTEMVNYFKKYLNP